MVMNYPRFSDEGCDGYHPGEEQPAMHNDEPQKPVLKPCPFCGAAGLLEPASNHDGWSLTQHYTVVCSDDECFASPLVIVGKTEAEAARRWNIRAGEASCTAADGAVEPASDLVERLNSTAASWEGDGNHNPAVTVYTGIIRTELLRDAAAALTALQQRAGTLERERDELRVLADSFEMELANQYANVITAEQRNREMREALEWYANPEIYKPHPHGLAFDDRDLSFRARAALADQPAGAQTNE
jgi:hypothetical protein